MGRWGVTCRGVRTGLGALGLTTLGSVMAIGLGWETVGEGGHTGPWLWLKVGKVAETGLEVEIWSCGFELRDLCGLEPPLGSLSGSISTSPPLGLKNLASSNACFLASTLVCASPLSITHWRGGREGSWHGTLCTV